VQRSNIKTRIILRNQPELRSTYKEDWIYAFKKATRNVKYQQEKIGRLQGKLNLCPTSKYSDLDTTE
jgi:hypothetical protein